MKNPGLPEKQGLYDPQFEHDACGVGFVCQMKGKRSHDIIQQALTILVNLDHRGACGCEVNTGDGAGILLQLPHGFFAKNGPANLPKPGHYGVGMLYVSPDAKIRAATEATFTDLAKAQGLSILGWRTVPGDNASLGQTAIASEPVVRQAFLGRPADCATDQDFERKLFILSKQAHHQIRGAGKDEFYYASSLSCRTIIYKGMLMPEQVGKYFTDLADKSMDTALALVHSRFSTNTFPSWERAHPYHYIAHNGEINTLNGNVNWMKAREPLLASPLFGKELPKILPIVNPNGSDSAKFDNVHELVVMGGRSLPEAMMMMVTEPLKAARKWLELKNVIRVIVRGEEISDWQDYSSLSYSSGGKLGVAFDPESIFTKNINQTTHLTFFLAMGVRSGFSGQAFNDLALGNIVIVKSINSSILIGVDGGMNETTIPLVKSLGVDFINTSSYFWNGDIEKTIQLVEGA